MESNQNSTNMATQNIESNINFKTIIGRFLGYLPYFIISLVLAISIAYLVNRYTPIKYSVKAQFLIKEFVPPYYREAEMVHLPVYVQFPD